LLNWPPSIALFNISRRENVMSFDDQSNRACFVGIDARLPASWVQEAERIGRMKIVGTGPSNMPWTRASNGQFGFIRSTASAMNIGSKSIAVTWPSVCWTTHVPQASAHPTSKTLARL
jgi:hypothetical protein